MSGDRLLRTWWRRLRTPRLPRPRLGAVRRCPQPPLASLLVGARSRCGGAVPTRAGLRGQSGSASLWVVTGGLLVLVLALVAGLRTTAVLARHRAESAADLAALAVAGGIGLDRTTAMMCARGARIAAVNGAVLRQCTVRLRSGARAGTVQVGTAVTVALAGLARGPALGRAEAERALFDAAPPMPGATAFEVCLSAAARMRDRQVQERPTHDCRHRSPSAVGAVAGPEPTSPQQAEQRSGQQCADRPKQHRASLLRSGVGELITGSSRHVRC